MIWTVIFTDYFYFWYQAQPLALRKRLAAAFGNIGFWGPELSRPLADTQFALHLAEQEKIK
ncbi:Uncharacterised protein [Cedecea davisae]|nr:hypothetical protein [Cedecea davisae]SUX38643.1 Uncharacterised protein [Cedecea davisae]